MLTGSSSASLNSFCYPCGASRVTSSPPSSLTCAEYHTGPSQWIMLH